MLNSVRIINFQAHADSHLEFSPGINAITGQSDQGKSSVLRAISWALQNNLRGDGHRREGAAKNQPMAVHLSTPEGIVIRSRKGTENQYVVDAVEYNAVGTSIPPAVSELLRMDSHCVQRQGDSPFMLADPPGDVAKAINKLAGFEIDHVFTALNSQQVRARATANAQADILADAQARLAVIPDADAAEKLLAVVERIQARIVGLESSRDSLASLVRRIGHASQRLADAQGPLRLKDQLKTAAALREQINQVGGARAALEALLASIARRHSAVARAENALAEVSAALTAARKQAKVCPTCNKPW